MATRKASSVIVLNRIRRLNQDTARSDHGDISAVQTWKPSQQSYHVRLSHKSGTWHSDIVPMFPEASTRSRRRLSPSRVVNSDGEMSLDLDQMSVLVHHAIMNDNLDRLREIYRDRKVNLVDRNGNTPLHLAARRGNPQIVKWLMKGAGIPVDIKNNRGETCAHHAMKLGHIKALKAIVYNGTVKPLAMASIRDGHGMTVLHFAAILGNHDAISWLVDAFGETLALIRNNHGQCALHFAAAKGHDKCVYTLCRLGKRVADARDAIANGHLDVLQLLLAQRCAEEAVKICDVRGSTPAHDAAQNGHVSCLRQLVEYGCDVHYRDEDGDTPYSLALRSNNVECVLYAKSLTNGQVVDPESVYTRVQSTVTADEINRNSIDTSTETASCDGDVRVNDCNSSWGTKAKKLRFRKSRDDSEQCEVQGHVLRGEFVLREQPISDVMRERQHHGRLKFRPAPLSFPHLDEIEKDLEMTRERNGSEEEHRYPNGTVPLYPENVQSDPVSGRVKRRSAPSPPPRPVARAMTSESGNGYVDGNHNRRQDGQIEKGTEGQGVSSVTDRLDRLQVKEPCFVGAFRKDSSAENWTQSTKRQAPSPPTQPVPPPRKKKEKRKRKHKTKITFLNVHGPDRGDEASDIEVVVNELQNLYSSNALSRNPSSNSGGFTDYMQWPSGGEPVPAEPPRDYSPERTTAGSEAQYSSVHTSTTSVPSGEEQPDAGVARRQTPSISIMADYEEVTAVVPPPPPPLPGLRVCHELERKPSVPLASDLITQRGQLRKTQGPNRKSRPRTRTARAATGAAANDGSKVSAIRNALEEKGILEPYLHRACGRSSSFDDAYQMINDSASGEGSRDFSPTTSPREVSPSSRFTYLPNGILTKPALKKVRGGNPGHGQRRAAQPTRRHTVSFQTSSDMESSAERNGLASSVAAPGRRDDEAWRESTPVVAPSRRQTSESSRHDIKHSVGQDLSHDDYNKLQATLRMHLEKPRELPKVNMRAVRQYEKLPDPPSELELFFKKRRQKMALENQEDDSQDHSSHITNGDPESINAMSRLIETEARADGRDSS